MLNRYEVDVTLAEPPETLAAISEAVHIAAGGTPDITVSAREGHVHLQFEVESTCHGGAWHAADKLLLDMGLQVTLRSLLVTEIQPEPDIDGLVKLAIAQVRQATSPARLAVYQALVATFCPNCGQDWSTCSTRCECGHPAKGPAPARRLNPRELRAGQTYRHYKGQVYKICSFAQPTEQCVGTVVVYENVDTHGVYTRPVDDFCGLVAKGLNTIRRFDRVLEP